jgi:3-phosphoshikimate 1-carboxyvinyltransferase
MLMKKVEIIPSKSDMHRYIICSALAGVKVSLGDHPSDDIKATGRCMEKLMRDEGQDRIDIFCGESGTTLRFLLPLAGALGKEASFHLEGRLKERPMQPFIDELTRHGMKISYTDSTYEISGRLLPGVYSMPGDISSQFISGLLISMPLIMSGEDRKLNVKIGKYGKTEEVIGVEAEKNEVSSTREEERSPILKVKGRLESRAYVDMTIKTLSAFGVDIIEKSNAEEGIPETIFSLKGPSQYRPAERYELEGDWSNAAFWIIAGLIGKEPVRISGLNMDTCQGDAAILELLRDMGGKIDVRNGPGEKTDIIAYPSVLKGLTIDVSETPDLAPPLALALCLSRGPGKITGASRLRLKESDRIRSTAELLRRLGADIREAGDELVISGLHDLKEAKLEGGRVSSCGDHRIAMTAAIASLVCERPVKLVNAGAVAKSYPLFFDEMAKMGFDWNLDIM